ILEALINCAIAASRCNNGELSMALFRDTFKRMKTYADDRRQNGVPMYIREYHTRGTIEWSIQLDRCYGGTMPLAGYSVLRDCWERVCMSLRYTQPDADRPLFDLEMSLVRLLLLVEDTGKAWKWLATIRAELISDRNILCTRCHTSEYRKDNTHTVNVLTDRLETLTSILTKSYIDRGMFGEAAAAYMKLAGLKDLVNCVHGREIKGRAIYDAAECMIRAGRYDEARGYFKQSCAQSWSGAEEQSTYLSVVDGLDAADQHVSLAARNVLRGRDNDTLSIGECIRCFDRLDQLEEPFGAGIPQALKVLTTLCDVVPAAHDLYKRLLERAGGLGGGDGGDPEHTTLTLGTLLIDMYLWMAEMYIALRCVSQDAPHLRVSGASSLSKLVHSKRPAPTPREMLKEAERMAVYALGVFEGLPEEHRSVSISNVMLAVQHYTRALYLHRSFGTKEPLYSHSVSGIAGRDAENRTTSFYKSCHALDCVETSPAVAATLANKVCGVLERVVTAYPRADAFFQYRHDDGEDVKEDDTDTNWWYHTLRVLTNDLKAAELEATDTAPISATIRRLKTFIDLDVPPSLRQSLTLRMVPPELFMPHVKGRFSQNDMRTLRFGTITTMKAIQKGQEPSGAAESGRGGRPRSPQQWKTQSRRTKVIQSPESESEETEAEESESEDVTFQPTQPRRRLKRRSERVLDDSDEDDEESGGVGGVVSDPEEDWEGGGITPDMPSSSREGGGGRERERTRPVRGCRGGTRANPAKRGRGTGAGGDEKSRLQREREEAEYQMADATGETEEDEESDTNTMDAASGLDDGAPGFDTFISEEDRKLQETLEEREMAERRAAGERSDDTWDNPYMIEEERRDISENLIYMRRTQMARKRQACVDPDVRGEEGDMGDMQPSNKRTSSPSSGKPPVDYTLSGQQLRAVEASYAAGVPVDLLARLACDPQNTARERDMELYDPRIGRAREQGGTSGGMMVISREYINENIELDVDFWTGLSNVESLSMVDCPLHFGTLISPPPSMTHLRIDRCSMTMGDACRLLSLLPDSMNTVVFRGIMGGESSRPSSLSVPLQTQSVLSLTTLDLAGSRLGPLPAQVAQRLRVKDLVLRGCSGVLPFIQSLHPRSVSGRLDISQWEHPAGEAYQVRDAASVDSHRDELLCGALSSQAV
ncbi:hypothetical protein KIPB_007729, partial [Kipferlia bialata]